MCLTDKQREAQRNEERQKLTSMSLQDLVTRAHREWQRAGWESPEDFSEKPNHPHVRLGWVIAELKKRAGVPDDVFFDFKGWRFRAPFHCMCCGKETSQDQWAFGRYCGTCDTGICQKNHLHENAGGRIFCGPNTELVDSIEAAKFNFTNERMTKVPPAKPMEWYPVKPLFPIGESLPALDERDEAKEKR